MKKNKIAALILLVVIFLVPFQISIVEMNMQHQLAEALLMAVTIIGSIAAILLYNGGLKDQGTHS